MLINRWKHLPSQSNGPGDQGLQKLSSDVFKTPIHKTICQVLEPNGSFDTTTRIPESMGVSIAECSGIPF